MFIPDANDVVRVRAINADLTDGDSVKWIHDNTIAGGQFRQYITPSSSTWSKTNAAKISVDFRIDTPGEYYIMLLLSTGNDECAVWMEVDGKQNEVGSNKTGQLNYLFAFFGVHWFWDHDSGNSQVTLDAGKHNVKISSITDGLFIQDIVIASITAPNLFGSIPVPFELYNHNGNEVDPVMVYPKDGDTIGALGQRFRFVENQKSVDVWRLRLGSTPGADDIWTIDWSTGNDFGIQGPNVLPLDGSIVYLSYSSLQGGTWFDHDDRVLYAANPAKPKQNYSDWLADSSNDPYRTMLAELDHANGTTTVASQPFLNNTDNIVYDDFIINSPYMASGLGRTIDVGDIEVVNPVIEENYLNNEYHGHRGRLLFGDRRWCQSKFRVIARAIIDDVRENSDRNYTFDLIGEAFKYNLPFPGFTNGFINTYTFKQAIVNLSDLWDIAGAHQYLNISDDVLGRLLRYEVTANSTIIEIINKIADSVNVEWRISQTGVLEFIKPDRVHQPSIRYTEDNIDIDGIRKVSSIHPVHQIRINFDNEQHYIHEIETDTASLDEELVVDTYLIDPVDVVNLARELEEEYVNRHDIYEFKVVGFADLTQEGDVVTVDHPRLSGSGVVENIQRTPLEGYSLVEVRF